MGRIANAALAVRPNYPDAIVALAQSRLRLGFTDEAIALTRRAIGIEPGRADIRNFLDHIHARSYEPGKALLREGDFRAGWESLRGAIERAYPASGWRYWDGRPVDGTLLVILNGHCFGGHGDAIQLARFLPRLSGLAHRVVVMGSSAILPLLQSIQGGESLEWVHISGLDGDLDLPPVDVTSSIHMTAVLAPDADCLGPVPYLQADPVRVQSWRERLSGVRDLRVGVAWRGSLHTGGSTDGGPERCRAFPLQALAPLAAVEKVNLVSLQLDATAGEIERARFPVFDPGLSTNWVETAALVDSLDLVVTLDSSVAHLAGALGRPVWMALPRESDWRWFSRDDYPDSSPWYSSMRIFRQDRPGDWAGVFSRMAVELEALARSRSTPGDDVVVG